MSTILIKADKESNKILSNLAKKLGGTVVNLKDAQLEDVLLGTMMDTAKTGESVTRESVFAILDGK